MGNRSSHRSLCCRGTAGDFVRCSGYVQRRAASRVSDFENRDSVAAKVSDLKRREPLGRTLLFDSIHQVLNDFAKLESGDAIYLVTDGGDNQSKTSLARLRHELINRGIR